MEYWSTRHRLNDLSQQERESKAKQLLQQLPLPRSQWDFDYFVAYRTNQPPTGEVTAEFFSSFGEARDWWSELSRNAFRLSDGDRLKDRISGTKQELMSALGELRQESRRAAF